MSADRIRSSPSPVSYESYARSTATHGTPAGAPVAAENTAVPSGVSQQSPYGQSGFDAGATQYAQATASGSYESTVAETPAPAPAATPAPVADPHAQLNALKNMSLEEKKDFLKQFGVTDKALKKSKPHEIENAFNQIVDQLKQTGEAKLKFKIGGKKFEAKIKNDPANGIDIQIKQKKGFFGKVWDGVKKYGKIALTVASFIPGSSPFAAAGTHQANT